MPSRTSIPDFWDRFFDTFESGEVRERSQSGRKLQYITARTVANRLDDAAGPENWWDDYIPAENSVICRLTIRLPDGSTITKVDAGGYAGMSDEGDDDKSGFSDAFKRAAVKFGVGRYLYRDGVPTFGDDAPAMPRQASTERPREPAREPERSQPATQSNGNVPRSGRALFAWTKDQEQKYEVGLLKYLNGWGKLQAFPEMMVNWDADQVDLAHKEAVRKLQSIATPSEPATSSPATLPTGHDGPDSLTIGDRTFARPTTGRDLFRAADHARQHFASSITRTLMDEAKAAGVTRQMAEWPAEYVVVAWGSLARHCMPKDAEPDPAIKEGQKSVFLWARKYVAITRRAPEHAIANADVQRMIASNYQSLWAGEAIESIAEVTDMDRLDTLAETFQEHIREAENVPEGI